MFHCLLAERLSVKKRLIDVTFIDATVVVALPPWPGRIFQVPEHPKADTMPGNEPFLAWTMGPTPSARHARGGQTDP
jgi:hypothetical protein